MKMLINKCYGGYSINEDLAEELGYESDYDERSRYDETLIHMVEEGREEEVNGSCAELEVVEIPDGATDWEMDEYDGMEAIIYVLDGKIHHL